MQYNLPTKVRFAIYLVTSIGSLVVAYLSATQAVSQDAVTLFAGLITLVGGLAAYNTGGK